MSGCITSYNDVDMVFEDEDTQYHFVNFEQYDAEKKVRIYGLPRIKYPLYRKGSKYYGKKRKTN